MDIAKFEKKLKEMDPKQLDNAELADRLGEVHSLLKAIETEDKRLKDEIKRRGARLVQGEQFAATVTDKYRTVFDKQALIQITGEEFANKFKKTNYYTQVDITPF